MHAADSFEHALAVAPVAAVLFDAGGGAYWRNAAAAEVLAASDGLSLARGRLEAASSSEQRRLAKAITQAVALHADTNVAVARPSGAPAYLIRVHRMGCALAAPAARAAAFIIAPRLHAALSADIISSAFQLTPGEARVAAGLCAVGGGIRETATALGLSPNTVKTLLQRAFGKTGARSQAELVTLLTGLGPTPDDRMADNSVQHANNDTCDFTPDHDARAERLRVAPLKKRTAPSERSEPVRTRL